VEENILTNQLYMKRTGNSYILEIL